MESNELIKSESGLVERVGNVISIANKILALNIPILIPYRKKDKWGFCTLDRKIVVDCVFDEVKLFSERVAVVKQNGYYGFVNRTGQIVIPVTYPRAYSFCGGVAEIRKKKDQFHRSFIDKDGREVFPRNIVFPKHDLKKTFDEQLKYGFKNAQGEQVITNKYDYVNDFREDLAAVKLEDKWGFIDKEDNLIVPFIFENVSGFRNGVASVKRNKKYGYIDKNSNTVIPFEYEDAYSFHEGLASAQVKARFGFIDIMGSAKIEFKYEYAFSFQNGLARVLHEGKYGYINKEGVEFWEH